MGPVALFDKSFLQSLSLDEAVFFDRFFLPVICPIFYIETLADLQKHVRVGRTPEQEVGIIADKVPEMSGWPCAFHIGLATGVLLGHDLPMDGRIPTSFGRTVSVDGKKGFAHDEPAETAAFKRWQNRQFLEVERDFAQSWRQTIAEVNLQTIAAAAQAMGINPTVFKSFAEVKESIDKLIRQKGDSARHLIKLSINALGLPTAIETSVLQRWLGEGSNSLMEFAPYAAHITSVELFFQTALGANLIGTSDANNRTDTAYLFYVPFSQIFVSSDKLHRRCVPHFLRGDQDFVWGPDLKADLHRLMEHYESLPEEQKEQGLMSFARTPPVEDEGLIVQLWDKHLIKNWRSDLNRPRVSDPDVDKELVDHINRVSSAEAVSEYNSDFDPTNPDFVQLTRNISRRKGQWWQVPKNTKG